MASVASVSALVMSSIEPKGVQDFMNRYIEALFPEAGLSREKDMERKMQELKDFSSQEVSLVHGPAGYRLSMKRPEEEKE